MGDWYIPVKNRVKNEIQHAKVDLDTYNWAKDHRWFISKYKKVVYREIQWRDKKSGGGRIELAREILQSAPRVGIVYKNGDILDLRRSNLALKEFTIRREKRNEKDVFTLKTSIAGHCVYLGVWPARWLAESAGEAALNRLRELRREYHEKKLTLDIEDIDKELKLAAGSIFEGEIREYRAKRTQQQRAIKKGWVKRKLKASENSLPQQNFSLDNLENRC